MLRSRVAAGFTRRFQVQNGVFTSRKLVAAACCSIAFVSAPIDAFAFVVGRQPNLDSRSVSKLDLCPTTNSVALFSSSTSNGGQPSATDNHEFRRYDKIQAEVVRFGQLGASVEVIGLGHNEEDCIGEDEPGLAYGLILQREIKYFRAARGGLDVIVGEVLPAYVERVRNDGRLDISLRDPGGKGKADSIGKIILNKLKETEDGTLDVGDKSTPDEINSAFPGTSKGAFKKAVAALYKQGLVKPSPNSISLIEKE